MREFEPGFRMPAPENGEALLKVQLLRRSCHIYYFIRWARESAALPAEEEGRQVGGGVVVTAVAFANERRVRLEFRHLLEKDSHCAFARLGDAALGQLINHGFKLRIVKTFS